jgi:hypothetical protein
MKEKEKQRLIIGGIILATIVILWLLFRSFRTTYGVRDNQTTNGNGMLDNITMPGLGSINLNDFPPLVYNPADFGGFEFLLNNPSNDLNGGFTNTNNMPIDQSTQQNKCAPLTQPQLMLYSGGIGGYSINSNPLPSNNYIPFLSGW